MPVAIHRNVDPAIARQLSDGIAGFNRTTVPNLEPNEAEVRFYAVATDDQGSVIGGLRAACYWNTLHIELLWLNETARGIGMGRGLIEQAEDFACGQHCEKALVETTSWQARGFYERLGYTHLATLPDRPKGHASHYLAKTLAA